MDHPWDEPLDAEERVKIKCKSILPSIPSLRCQRAVQLVAIDETRDDASLVGQATNVKRKSFLPSISFRRCQPAVQVIAIDETRDDASLVGQATSIGRISVGENSAHQPKEIQDRQTRMLSLKDLQSDEKGLQAPASVTYQQKNQKRPQGAGGEVLMSHSDTLKYIFTQEGEKDEGVLMSHTNTLKYLLEDCGLLDMTKYLFTQEGDEEEGVLMSHTDTLKYLLEDCGFVTTNFQDVGVKESSLMPSLEELLKHLLEDCGINATDIRDVEVKESTPKPSLKELRIKSALIKRDIEMIKGAAAVNNLSTSAVNVIINELRMKNESIKRDIAAAEVPEAGDGSSLFKLALPSGIFSVAGCASAGPPELSQCKEPSMARKEAGINCVNPQKKDGSSQEQQGRARGEYDEVLMSHADTLKYLLKDCGIAGINRGDPQNKDGSSQKQQERAQGKEEAEVLMSHADTLRYLLKDCGIGI